jgi:thioesterase domain-containing protein
MIAFEMAQQLIAAGEEVARLILVDPPVRPFPAYAVSPAQDAIRRLQSRPADSKTAEAHRDALISTITIIDRAAREYQLRPYAGDLAILCSAENFGSFQSDTSDWRKAVKGRLNLTQIAPTHMSIVGANASTLGAHVRRVLGTP